MRNAKIFLGALLALLVVIGMSWYWGASGKWETQRALEARTVRSDLIEGRSRLLDARIDVYNVNFGDTSRHLQDAKDLLSGIRGRLNTIGREGDGARLDAALLKIDEAQRMAGQLDQSANARVAEAAQLLEEVLK